MNQVRRNNRCLQLNRNGFKPSIRRQRYNIQNFDLVEYQGKKYISCGVMSYGRYITFRKNKDNLKYGKFSDIKLLYYGKGLFVNMEVVC